MYFSDRRKRKKLRKVEMRLEIVRDDRCLLLHHEI